MKLKKLLDNTSILEKAQEEMGYDTFLEVLQGDVPNIDLFNFEMLYDEFITSLEKQVNQTLDYDIRIGLLVHIVCSISNIIDGKLTPSCYSKEDLKKRYSDIFKAIRKSISLMEEFYKLQFSDDELCFILRNVVNE